MKTKEEIEKKLEELYNKRLKVRFKRYLKVSHHNCIFNEKVVLQDNSAVRIGCCRNKFVSFGDTTIKICNEDCVAERCNYYEAEFTKEEIEENFLKDIKDPKICGMREPKIFVLLWVLHEGDNGGFPELKESFWKRLWKKLFGYV